MIVRADRFFDHSVTSNVHTDAHTADAAIGNRGPDWLDEAGPRATCAHMEPAGIFGNVGDLAERHGADLRMPAVIEQQRRYFPRNRDAAGGKLDRLGKTALLSAS